MPGINLLRDTGVGDQREEETEQEAQRRTLDVELTNPERKAARETTEQPSLSFWGFLKDFFTKIRGRRLAQPSPGKPALQPPSKKVPKPEKKAKPRILSEHYERPTAQEPPEVVDIFAQENLAEPASRPAKATIEKETPPAPKPPVRPAAPPKADTAPPEKKETEPKIEEGPRETFLGVNLVPEEMMPGIEARNRPVVLGFIALATILLLATVYVGLSIYQRRTEDQSRENLERIAGLEQEITALSVVKNETLAYHDRLKSIAALLEQHYYWTKFLAGVEKYTIDTVYLRIVTADGAGRMTVSGSGKDFRSVARQLLAYRQADDFVQDVSITSASIREAEKAVFVDFTATITLVEDVFFRDAEGRPEYKIEQ